MNLKKRIVVIAHKNKELKEIVNYYKNKFIW